MKAKLILVGLLGISGVASAGDLKSEITTMNAKITSAMMKRDIAGFSKIVKAGITPDFKYIEAGRSMTFDQMLVMMKQGMAGFTKMTEVKSAVVSLEQTGDQGVATMRHTQSGTMLGPDKKPHTMTIVGLSKDSYRKVKGTWKMSSMNWVKTEQMLMDNKAMAVPKQAPKTEPKD